MSRWTWVAAMVASAGLLGGCGGADDTAADAPGAKETAEASTELTLPPDSAGRCMPPSVENLRVQDTAFEGTVTAMTEQEATLEVSRTYAGTPASSVTVSVPGKDMSDLILAVDFQQGQTYLISSLDGQVSVCGLSGPKDALLEGLYQDAYAG
ncbi:MAG: hypothetical protein JWN68_1233 [Nocardioides sp.]|jgi:hypothetical protein|uniref:hypothetical protein n=1 Tax=Nocardioides sp. TaxID=35761 RepID=UPI00261DCEA9|nr:hypothetical protein [Nocardioides sp.]MCW2833280.1 hypothetical protein [Nocardioides sp.]